MYQLGYAESIGDSPRECRDRERRALDQAIALLEQGENAGLGSPAAGKAVHFVCTLWKALIEDLICPENDLPDILRGDLVSVGIWILKEADAIQRGRSNGFGGLIEICSMIRDGLR